jgi:hypothetical protein
MPTTLTFNINSPGDSTGDMKIFPRNQEAERQMLVNAISHATKLVNKHARKRNKNGTTPLEASQEKLTSTKRASKRLGEVRRMGQTIFSPHIMNNRTGTKYSDKHTGKKNTRNLSTTQVHHHNKQRKTKKNRTVQETPTQRLATTPTAQATSWMTQTRRQTNPLTTTNPVTTTNPWNPTTSRTTNPWHARKKYSSHTKNGKPTPSVNSRLNSRKSRTMPPNLVVRHRRRKKKLNTRTNQQRMDLSGISLTKKNSSEYYPHESMLCINPLSRTWKQG